MTAEDIAKAATIVSTLAGGLESPLGPLLAVAADMVRKACTINPEDPVKVLREASYAMVQAQVDLKYGPRE